MLTKQKGKISTSQNQEKLWPRRRSQRVTLKITHKQIKIGLSHLSKNPIKENFWGKLLNEKRKLLLWSNLSYWPLWQRPKPERYNSCQKKGWLPYLQQKLSLQAHYWQFNSKCVHTSCVKSESVYTRPGHIQAACIPETLKQIKAKQANPGRDYWYWEPESLEDSDTYFK